MKQSNSLETCQVVSTETQKVAVADILRKSDKSIRVVLHGSNIIVNMTRTDVRRPYVGTLHGLEFTTQGQ